MEQKYFKQLIFSDPELFRDGEGGSHIYVIYGNKSCFESIDDFWHQVELEIIKHKFKPGFVPLKKELSAKEFIEMVVDRLLLLKARFKIDSKILKKAYLMDKDWWITSMVAEFEDCFAMFEWWTEA